MRIGRHINPLRGSQLITHGILKENSCGNRHKIVIRNLSKGTRQVSQDNRAFRNITNLCLGRKQNDKSLIMKLKNVINNKENKLVISRSFTTRQHETNKGITLASSKRDDSKRPNPQLCEEYINEIDQYLQTIEEQHLPYADYMIKQKDVTNSMRSILVDWLIDVNIRFKLLPETLFLTINIIDRYLSKVQVPQEHLQLLGITASLIACKYEEIYPPEIKDFIYITNYAYTKTEVLSLEQKILASIEFNLNVPSSNRFLQRFSKTLNSPKNTYYLAQYLIELALVEYKMLNYKPSLIAASALYTSHKLNNDSENWGEEMWKLTGESPKTLSPCIKEMIIMLEGAPTATLQAVRKKFATVKYMEVAQVKICKKN